MKTLTLTAAYLAALAVVLFWWLLVQVAVRCDHTVRQDWESGEAFDHFDPALARLERLHTALFGVEE